MPNHVTNEIIFRGVDTATQDRILAQVCDSDGHVDFNLLVPAPLNIWWGAVCTEHENPFKRTHLDWAVANWGTKWNAYEHRPIERTDSTLILRFDTAWSPPYPWLAAVFNHFKLSFEHNYLDEPANWSQHGVFDYSKLDGLCPEPWKEERASDGLHKRLHILKWGCGSFDEEEATGGVDGRAYGNWKFAP